MTIVDDNGTQFEKKILIPHTKYTIIDVLFAAENDHVAD